MAKRDILNRILRKSKQGHLRIRRLCDRASAFVSKMGKALQCVQG
jgi:hypothetical protein